MFILPAYAKLNLALDVTGRAANGLHTLESVVVRIDWHDLVAVSLDAASLRLQGRIEGVPADGSNLAARAANLVLDRWAPGRRAGLWIHKRLPERAGLGGGSADAAAALRGTAALLRLAGVAAPPEELQQLAASLGSDVPAVLAGGAQFVSGTGDVLGELPSPRLHVVVSIAGASSTTEVYAALSDSERRPDGRAAALRDALCRGAPLDPGLLGSALEVAAFRANPQLAEAAARIRSSTKDVSWHMTGSGGAMFALADGTAEAERLAAAVTAAGFEARACHTVGC